jgi:hypothetical protein
MSASISGIKSWKFERAQVSAIARNLNTGHSHQEIVEEAADLREGDVVCKLEVPRIGISVMVLQGMKQNTLVAGSGHVPGTPAARHRRQCRNRSTPGHVFPQTGRDTACRTTLARKLPLRLSWATELAAAGSAIVSESLPCERASI